MYLMVEFLGYSLLGKTEISKYTNIQFKSLVNTVKKYRSLLGKIRINIPRKNTLVKWSRARKVTVNQEGQTEQYCSFPVYVCALIEAVYRVSIWKFLKVKLTLTEILITSNITAKVYGSSCVFGLGGEQRN